MCKTVDKINELYFLADRMAYDLGYKAPGKSDEVNPFTEYSVAGICWDKGKKDAESGDEPMTKSWRP